MGFECGNGNGVGDDEHGWACDGLRNKMWHAGAVPLALPWPEPWIEGGVVGCAIDINDSMCRMDFAYNGVWAEGATFHFKSQGRAFYPAVSLNGSFEFLLASKAFQFKPPDHSYHALLPDDPDMTGVYSRPKPMRGTAAQVATRNGRSDISLLISTSQSTDAAV